MLYHPNGDAESYPISRKKFEQIFGVKYKKSDYGVRFEDGHCGVNPYDEDINGIVVPLVRGSLKEYVEYHNILCDEI